MRDIKKLDWHRYIPKWDNNSSDENPIELEIHPLSQVELSRYGRLSLDLQKKNPESYVNDLSQKMFIENVRNVKNLKCNGSDILTSEKLWDLGIANLNNEITEAMLDISRLQDHEKKT